MMNMNYKAILLPAKASFLLVSCSPAKHGEKKPEEKRVEQKKEAPAKKAAAAPSTSKNK